MKRWLAIFGILVIAAVIAVSVARRIQPEMCDAIFERIQLGMTLEEVDAALGRRGQQMMSGFGLFEWQWKDPAGDDIQVIVSLNQDGKVRRRMVRVQSSDGRTTAIDDE
jgi:hypothetical protein